MTVVGTTVGTTVNETGAETNAAPSVAEAAAPKKTKLMLTDLERIVEQACIETGDSPAVCLEHDEVLAQRIVAFVQGGIRTERIQARLDNNPVWLKDQIRKLKASVRERRDEPRGDLFRTPDEGPDVDFQIKESAEAVAANKANNPNQIAASGS